MKKLFFAFIVLSLVSCKKDKPDPILCDMTIGEDYIVFEAEATTSELGDWEIIDSTDNRYRDEDSIAPINGTHLEYAGVNSYNEPVWPLEYTFIAPKTATYRLTMRLYQRLEGEESDKCNDVYIKMAGNFTSGNDVYSTDELKGDMKFFGRGIDQWGCSYFGDLNNQVQGKVLYNLIEGEEYTFTMSGRSERTNIDYILFFDNELGITVKSNQDLAEKNDEKYRPDWSCNE
jgi:hypothetical protein